MYYNVCYTTLYVSVLVEVSQVFRIVEILNNNDFNIILDLLLLIKE